MDTRHRIQLEYIAYNAAERGLTDDEIRNRNRGGWTIEVRYGHEEEDRWTRTEGIVLDPPDVERVIRAATYIRSKEWQGERDLTERVDAILGS